MSIIDKLSRGGNFIVKHSGLKAVHDSDIESLLKSLEVYDVVINGEAVCHFCSKKITIDDIQAVLPINNEVAFCCSDDECYKNLLEKGSFDVS